MHNICLKTILPPVKDEGPHTFFLHMVLMIDNSESPFHLLPEEALRYLVRKARYLIFLGKLLNGMSMTTAFF